MSSAIILWLGATLTLISSVASPRQTDPTAKAHEHFRTGMVALASEQFEKAEAEFKKAVAIDPLHHAAFYGLGQVYMATKRYGDAVKAYLDSRKAFLDALSADRSDGATRERRLRDQLQAVREYGRTLQRRSGTQSPGLAAAIERNREEERQLQVQLSRSDASGPAQVPAGLSMALGSAYFRTQNLEAAEREYLEAIRAEPKFGEAHNNLAVIYMLTGKYDLADQEIALAEKSGFKVNPQLKQDLKKRRGQ